ncbi:MAG: hypothetical protein PVF53_12925, partial [Desulfobacterales bacterium]
MDVEHQTWNGLICSDLKNDRAKRFHPSSFVNRHSIFCGSLFNEVSYKHRLWPPASSLIRKETDERLKPLTWNELIRLPKKDGAKRFHPSSFVIRHSIFCGSLFN